MSELPPLPSPPPRGGRGLSERLSPHSGERQRSITLRAQAKINLGLEVIGRRDDGMHEVATILQTIDLADRLRLTRDDDLTLRCHGMDVEPMNLILRAARAFKDYAGVRDGCAIECWKRIPVGAGLGGGSVDAAATLAALNMLWRVGASREELAGMARKLGADVPFGLCGGTALATGTGATLKPLTDAPRHWLVLVPLESEEAAKTAVMYRSLTAEDFSDGGRARRQEASLSDGKLSYDDVRSAFTPVARRRWPSVARALDQLAESNPLAACVSGAGPSVLALYASKTEAIRARDRVGPPARVHRFTTSNESDARRLTDSRVVRLARQPGEE